MAAVSALATWPGLPGKGALFHTLFVITIPALTAGADPNASDIGTFFDRLTTDLTIFALAMAGFFFALAALFYMASGATGNERTRQHAVSALYATLAGLALALLSGSIAALVNNAALGK